METEERVRWAFEHYAELTQRARDYWDEWQGYVSEGDRRYALYQEYKAKHEALGWVLGELDYEGVSYGADGPRHTVFPPDWKEPPE